MKHYKNNRRRYRNNSFDRNLKINTNDQNLNSSFGNVSDFKKRNFSRNNFNSSKLIQKYSNLAREALSVGDKILYENYMQHAEHFIRNSEGHNNNSNLKDKVSETVNKVSLEEINNQSGKKEDKLQVEEN